MLHHAYAAISSIAGEAVKDVLFDELQCKPIVVDKDDKSGMAAKGFKSQCTSAGEKVKNRRIDDSIADYIEQGLSCPVRGRANAFLVQGRSE